MQQESSWFLMAFDNPASTKHYLIDQMGIDHSYGFLKSGFMTESHDLGHT